jgi:competence protein ComEA
MLEKLRNLKKIDFLLMTGMGMVIMGLGLSLKNKEKPVGETLVFREGATPTMAVKPTIAERKVMVEVAGEVLNPGVYRLALGTRVNDALIVAGGLAAKADRNWVERNVNRAQILADGQKIYIPKVGVVTSGAVAVVSKTVLGEKIINVNTATVEEFDSLSGIGPALAKRIVDYREKVGSFKDINELKLVTGIGDKLYEKIKDELSI